MILRKVLLISTLFSALIFSLMKLELTLFHYVKELTVQSLRHDAKLQPVIGLQI